MDVAKLVSKSVRNLQKDDHDGIEVRLGEIEPLIAKGKVEHLRIILINLPCNAIDHSKSRCVDVSVQNNCIRVKDDGIGVSLKYKSKLFEQFFRGEHSKGYGLGLHISKCLCDYYNWSIMLDSELGRRAEVRVCFSN